MQAFLNLTARDSRSLTTAIFHWDQLFVRGRRVRRELYLHSDVLALALGHIKRV
jgi:hypothetical protein